MPSRTLRRYWPGDSLPRHRHATGYAALVLEGGYVEAGDRGRFVLEAGNVVFHGAYESHRNTFSAVGARVLDLDLVGQDFAVGSVADPDAIVRLAERDPLAAGKLLEESAAEQTTEPADWPDQLAQCLIDCPSLNLGEWARKHELAPQTLSSGFRKAFGVTPKQFRAEQRALHAHRSLPGWHATGAALDAELGFADQAHMTRSVVALTGQCPSQLMAK